MINIFVKDYTYILIDPRNNQPFYVGKGQGNRATAHLQTSHQKYNPLKTNKIKSILRSGKELVVERHYYSTEQEAFNEETNLIKLYGKLIDGSGILTNIDDGGRGGSRGRVITEQTRSKLKQRNRYIFTSKDRSTLKPKIETHRRKLQQNCPKATPVIQYDLTGTMIASYISAREAGKQTGIDNSYISQCCRGRHKSAGGYVWNYGSHGKHIHGDVDSSSCQKYVGT